MKNNKGVTLVALVITIIVLLILAGVSIAMLVGEDGVLNRATNAADKTAAADAKSALENAVMGAQGSFVEEWETNPGKTFLGWLTLAEINKNIDTATYTVNYNPNAKTGDLDQYQGTVQKSGSTKTYKFTLAATTGNLGAKITWAE